MNKKYLNSYARLNRYEKTFRSIKERCSSPSSSYYKRGIKYYITVKDIKFLWNRDKGYKMKFPTVHRINSKGDYTLNNCMFIERSKHMKIRKLKNNQWALHHNNCIICKTTKKKHAGKGLCTSCFYYNNRGYYE